MAIDIIGRTSLANDMKANLDASAQRVRGIADRVARASAQRNGFALPGEQKTAENATEAPIDIEAEMVNLADEQLRYEATAKFLEKTYAGLRASLRER